MSSPVLTPEQEADAHQLAALIRQATDEEFLRLARLLVSQDQRHTFGPTEFAVRDIVLKAGAQAYQTFLAQKKTATAGRA